MVSSPAFNLLFIFSCLLYNSTLSRSANKLCLLPTGHCNRHTRDKDACLPVVAIVSSLLVYISNRGMSSNWCNQLFQVNSSFDNVLCAHTHTDTNIQQSMLLKGWDMLTSAASVTSVVSLRGPSPLLKINSEFLLIVMTCNVLSKVWQVHHYWTHSLNNLNNVILTVVPSANFTFKSKKGGKEMTMTR